MEKKEKDAIFKQVLRRQERQVLLKEGVSMPFGESEVSVRPLPWDQSNTLEDELVSVMSRLGDIADAKDVKWSEIVSPISKLLKDDLLNLANIVCGDVTLESIRENNVTKAEVIDILVKGLELNYGYLGNLASLSAGLMSK